MWIDWRRIPADTWYEDEFGDRYINRDGVRYVGYPDGSETPELPTDLDYPSDFFFNIWYGPFRRVG